MSLSSTEAMATSSAWLLLLQLEELRLKCSIEQPLQLTVSLTTQPPSSGRE
jgi:hypothetical protein